MTKAIEYPQRTLSEWELGEIRERLHVLNQRGGRE